MIGLLITSIILMLLNVAAIFVAINRIEESEWALREKLNANMYAHSNQMLALRKDVVGLKTSCPHGPACLECTL